MENKYDGQGVRSLHDLRDALIKITK